jgi:hypothetical protein
MPEELVRITAFIRALSRRERALLALSGGMRVAAVPALPILVVLLGAITRSDPAATTGWAVLAGGLERAQSPQRLVGATLLDLQLSEARVRRPGRRAARRGLDDLGVDLTGQVGLAPALVTAAAGTAVIAGRRALSADAVRAVREDW